MTDILNRRRALMAAEELSSIISLYDTGIEAPITGGFNATGYKYGVDGAFTQSKGASYLVLQSLSQYNIHGGRTWTTTNTIPSNAIGKTLRATGTVTNTANNSKRTFVRLYNSGNVVDASDTESVDNSGAFVGAQYAQFDFSLETDVPAGTTKSFDISLPVTFAGYVSVMFYKGYTGNIVVHVDKIWIE